jgi:3'-phosphoadenosine 5'-phosphosulfate (PAPS) 3'-phosphatase
MILYLLRQSTALRSCRSLTSYPIRIRHSPSVRNPRGRLPLQKTFQSMKDDNISTPRDQCQWRPTGAPGSLERLCSVSLRACQLMNPLISSVYQQLVSSNLDNDSSCVAGGVQKLKQDNSAFTIADGLVQRLLTDTLYSHVAFRDIVGEEEDDEECNNQTGDESWYQVQGLTIPIELRPVVESTKISIDALAEAYFLSEKNNTASNKKCLDYQTLTVFIDPIDGTREFSTGMGEQCSVCIGFANEYGKAVAGVIYRPLSYPQPTWVAGAKSERFAVCDFGGDNMIQSLDNSSSTSLLEMNSNGNMDRRGLLTTNGSISPFLESLIEELQSERVKSGGAGNKLMMLLEQSIFGNHADGRSVLYIQDRGVSRWDTCGAEGVLEAFGGKLMKLTTFLPATMYGKEEQEQSKFKRESYTYLASPTNLDFISGVPTITKYNCSPTTKDVQGNQKALEVNDVKAYSNLCGLVAFGKEWNTPEGIMYIEKAIQRTAMIHPPSFD